MRKLALVLIVLLLASPAMAAVELIAEQVGDTNEVQIKYVADSNVSGFALKVTADTGATITKVDNYHEGESTGSSKGYGIFPPNIDVNEDDGSVTGWGTPIRPSSMPGAAGTGIGNSAVVLDIGALYQDGNEPNLSGTLCSVWVTDDNDCNVCVEAESTGGNVVYTNASEATIDDSNACAALSFGCPCYGDLDDSGKVDSSDLLDIVGLLNDYGGRFYEIPSTDSHYNECADLDDNGKIDSSDLLDLVGWLNDYGGRFYEINCPHSYGPS
jgi:hypothetical protein